MATTMTDFTAEREAMVERQLRRRGITEPHILDAFRAVPREAFISDEYAHLAYGDHPLPIEAGQTISQPYIVALSTELINPQSEHVVLEIGTGSGYQAAVLAGLVKHVYSIESQAPYRRCRRSWRMRAYVWRKKRVFGGRNSWCVSPV